MQKSRIWRYWLLGAALTAALFAVLFRVSDFRFENSDDGLIMKAFLGFEGGTPTSFTLFTHTVLAWALCGLSTVVPSIAWFSVFQLALLFFSGTVLLKCMMQLSRAYRFPWLAGGAAGTLFLGMFMAFAACRISYTTTAALAGAAAVAQFLTIGASGTRDGQVIRASLLSLCLLLCAYALRATGALPSLAFIALAFLWLLYRRGRTGAGPAIRLKPLLISLTLFVFAMGAMVGLRAAEVQSRDLQPSLDWHQARTALMDYTAFEGDPVPALAAKSGLPETEVELVRQWYFLDANITTQALSRMAEAYAATKNTSPLAALTGFFEQSPRYVYAAILLMALCALCLTGGRKAAPLGGLVALLALLGCAVLLLFLGWRGRVLARAVDAALLPCAAMLFCVALSRHLTLEGIAIRRVAVILLSALVLASAALNIRQTYHDITRAPDTVSQQREAELEAYALAHSDQLVVRSPNLLRDTRLLPDVSAGIPGNITIWGDWNCRTPGWYAQLEKLGFDGQTFTAKDWLRDTIVFAAASVGETDALRAYLTDALGGTVVAVPCGQSGTLTLYRFRLGA